MMSLAPLSICLGSCKLTQRVWIYQLTQGTEYIFNRFYSMQEKLLIIYDLSLKLYSVLVAIANQDFECWMKKKVDSLGHFNLNKCMFFVSASKKNCVILHIYNSCILGPIRPPNVLQSFPNILCLVLSDPKAFQVVGETQLTVLYMKMPLLQYFSERNFLKLNVLCTGLFETLPGRVQCEMLLKVTEQCFNTLERSEMLLLLLRRFPETVVQHGVRFDPFLFLKRK